MNSPTTSLPWTHTKQLLPPKMLVDPTQRTSETLGKPNPISLPFASLTTQGIALHGLIRKDQRDESIQTPHSKPKAVSPRLNTKHYSAGIYGNTKQGTKQPHNERETSCPQLSKT